MIEEIRYEREILESYLFNDNNKISKSAIKFILSKWTLLESRLQQEHLEKEKIAAIYSEYVRKETVKTYAQKTIGETQVHTMVETGKNRKQMTMKNTNTQYPYRKRETKKIIIVKPKKIRTQIAMKLKKK